MTLRNLVATGALAAVASAAEPAVSLHPCPRDGFLPDAAAAGDGAVHLVFHRGEASGCDIFHCEWSAESGRFSDPVRINSTPGAAIAAGAVRGAHLAIGADDSLHVAWMGSLQATPARDHHRMPMCYSRSLDGGKSFEAQRNVVTSAYGLDGGGTLAADRKGNIHVLWHASGGEPGAEHRKVVVASSHDNGGLFAPEQRIDIGGEGVCPCCGIRAAASPAGEFFMLFRGAPAADRRGINVFAIDPARATATRLHRDPWRIATCPVSSGSLAFSAARFAVAWETAHRVKVGIFDRGTKSLLRAVTVPDPAPKAHQKHPSVSLAVDGSFLVAWLEVAGWGRPGVLRWQQFNHDGEPSGAAGAKILSVSWTRPAIVETGSGYAVFH